MFMGHGPQPPPSWQTRPGTSFLKKQTLSRLHAAGPRALPRPPPLPCWARTWSRPGHCPILGDPTLPFSPLLPLHSSHTCDPARALACPVSLACSPPPGSQPLLLPFPLPTAPSPGRLLLSSLPGSLQITDQSHLPNPLSSKTAAGPTPTSANTSHLLLVCWSAVCPGGTDCHLRGSHGSRAPHKCRVRSRLLAPGTDPEVASINACCPHGHGKGSPPKGARRGGAREALGRRSGSRSG